MRKPFSIQIVFGVRHEWVKNCDLSHSRSLRSIDTIAARKKNAACIEANQPKKVTRATTSKSWLGEKRQSSRRAAR